MEPIQKPVAPFAQDDPPPKFFGSWRNVYLAVVVYLISLILLFALFRKAFEA
jgi:hypothetical protein